MVLWISFKIIQGRHGESVKWKHTDHELITVEAAEKGVLRWWSHYTVFFPLLYIFETFHNRR